MGDVYRKQTESTNGKRKERSSSGFLKEDGQKVQQNTVDNRPDASVGLIGSTSGHFLFQTGDGTRSNITDESKSMSSEEFNVPERKVGSDSGATG